MHRSKVPLRIWVYAFWLLGRRRKGIAALQFQRETGIKRYETAWALLHKVRMALDDSEKRPIHEGVVEVDESMWGGRGRRAGRRLGHDGAWLLAAVERIEVRRRGKSYTRTGEIRAAVATSTDGRTLRSFVEKHVEKGAKLATDGWKAYDAWGPEVFDHSATVVGNDVEVLDHALPKVHLFFSNFKRQLHGTHHHVSGRYVGLYLAEHAYRANRRHKDTDLAGFIARRVMRRPWVPTAKLVRPPWGSSEAIG
jgi:hypothetical protein